MFNLAVALLVAPLAAPSVTVSGALADGPRTSGLSDMELAIWNDPSFKRRFAESYMAVTEVEPTVTLVERDHMQEVLDKISSNKMDKAVALLQKHGGPGASAVFDFTLGNIYFQRDDFAKAVVHYRAAVNKHPKFQRAYGNLGLIHVRQKDFRRAADAFSQVIRLGGGDAVNYGLLGFSYSNLDDHLAAESAYRMAVLLDSGTMDWKRGLARAFFKQGRYADAVALCETLIAKQSDQPEFWLLQANAYIGQGLPLKAVENYEVVDRLGGSTVDSLNNLGDIYINESLFDLAVDSYIRAMDRAADGGSPDRAIRAAKVLSSRGALAETGRLVAAIEARRGEQLGSDAKKDLLKLRARIAVAQGAGEEEARVLEQIVELDPLDGEALILLGKHARRGGDAEKAAFYFERAASLEDFEADAKVAHAQLLVGEGKYAEALPLLRRSQLLNPRDNVQQYMEQVERVAQKR